jgi:hypothetical protein
MSTPTKLRCMPGTLPTFWWGWIIAPGWWLAQFEVRYALIPWACDHGHSWTVPAAGGVAWSISIALVLWSWRAQRRAQGRQPLAFLAAGGVWMTIFFSALILTQLLPDVFMDPCRQ